MAIELVFETHSTAEDLITGVPMEDLLGEDFAWQDGWEYRVS